MDRNNVSSKHKNLMISRTKCINPERYGETRCRFFKHNLKREQGIFALPQPF
uniref:Uncharacterized protein n=1 Tax=Arundo donax TaxID=35708 RepID=A0A0A9ASL5_ARUDO